MIKKRVVEVADVFRRRLHVVHQERPPGEVERDQRERFVHRQQEAPVTADALLHAQRLRESVAHGQTEVLHRVMAVHLQVALRLHREIESAVPREEREHVVHERDAGIDFAFSGTVQVPLHINRSLGRFPINFARSHPCISC